MHAFGFEALVCVNQINLESNPIFFDLSAKKPVLPIEDSSRFRKRGVV